jgi:hypothetical protein
MHGISAPLSATHGSPDAEPVRLVPFDQAALMLGITRREVYNRLRAGDIEGLHIGKKHQILVASIDAFIERRREAERAGEVAS